VTETDQLRRFIFQAAPVRGHWVRLSRAWIEAREHQVLPPLALSLLGESLAAVALFSASLKFKGTLTWSSPARQASFSGSMPWTPRHLICIVSRPAPPSGHGSPGRHDASR
jgi:hypothetical protein